MTAPRAVLLIDFDAELEAEVRGLLQAKGLVARARAGAPEALTEALAAHRFDVALAQGGHLDRLERALSVLRRRAPGLPLIVVGEAPRRPHFAAVFAAGARDWVERGALERLVPALEREQAAAEARRACERCRRCLTLHEDVMQRLGTEEAPGEAVGAILMAVARHLELAEVSFWCPADDGLRRSAAVRADGGPSEPWGGEAALVARAWQARKLVWLEEDKGATGSLALPVGVAGRREGVLALCDAERACIDGDVVRTMQTVGEQLAKVPRQAKAREALARSEAQRAALLTSAVDPFVVMDAEGVIREWNPAAERLFGWRREEAVGRTALELLAPAELREPLRERVRAHLDAGSESPAGEGLRLVCQRRDGSRLPLAVGLIRAEADGATLYAAHLRDASSEQRIEENQRLLAEAGTSLSASLDYPGVLERVARLLAPALAEGCVVEVGADDARHDVAVALENGDGEPGLLAEVEAGGWGVFGAAPTLSTRWPMRYPRTPQAPSSWPPPLIEELAPSSAVSLPLFARGRAIGAVTLLRSRRPPFDAADLEIAQDLARKAAFAIDNARLYQHARESVRARDEFLSLAAHELKTPLTPLHLRLQSLIRNLRRAGAEPRLSEDALLVRLDDVDQAVRRLEQLVEGLLEISRMAIAPLHLERSRVDLTQVVRRVIERMCGELEAAGSPLELHLDDGVTGTFDPSRIEQVVTSLISNALKYGAGEPIRIEARREDRHACFTVQDRGIGVALAEQERIFERFGRVAPLRNYGGFGLGLWSVRQIVEAHGGRVRLESAPGKGARFTVELPTNPEPLFHVPLVGRASPR